MSPKELRSKLTEIGYLQKDIAKTLGVTEETVSRWVNGKLAVPEYVVAYLEAAGSIKKIRDWAKDRNNPLGGA